MTIHLPKDVENPIIAKVYSGLFPSVDAAMTEAARLLLDRLEHGQGEPPAKKALTPDELNQRLLASGLITHLANPAEDIDDADDLPIPFEGEPLSETIIRERR